MATTLGTLNPFRYRGYVYDEETGLYYLRSRYYNPVWGRFVNADDLIGRVGGLLQHNLFTYCLNTPIRLADFNGNSATMISPYYTIGGVTVSDENYNTYMRFKSDYEKLGGKELVIDTIKPFVIPAQGEFLGATYPPRILSVTYTSSTTYVQGILSDIGNTLSDQSSVIGAIAQSIAKRYGYEGDVNMATQGGIQFVSAFVPGLFPQYTESVLTIRYGYWGIPNEDSITRKFSILKDSVNNQTEELTGITFNPSRGSGARFLLQLQ